MRKRVYMSLCTAFSFLAMQAQLVVNNNGQVIVGAEEHHAAVLNGGHYPSTSELYVEQTSDNGMVLIADNANQNETIEGSINYEADQIIAGNGIIPGTENGDLRFKNASIRMKADKIKLYPGTYMNNSTIIINPQSH